MKNLIFKLSGVTATLALMMTVFNVNSACIYFTYQAELPKGSEKLSLIN